MRHTFHISPQQLNEKFISELRAIFAQRSVKVTVEDAPSSLAPDIEALNQQVLALPERFKNAAIDPDIDLSAMANEVNL